MVGHIALNMVIYAEKLENNLKKHKIEKKNSKENKNEDDGK